MISLGALGIVLYFAPLGQVIEVLQHAQYGYLPIAICLFILSLIARSMGWRTMLQEQINGSRLFFVINIGYLVNNIFPFRAGEISRAILVSQTSEVSFWQVASSIIIERAFDLLIAVSLLITSIPFVLVSSSSPNTTELAKPAAIISGGIVILGFFILHILAKNRELVIAKIHILSMRFPLLSKLRVERLDSFFLGLVCLTKVSRFLQVLGWMLLTWAFQIAQTYVLLRIFVDHIDLYWITFALGVTSLGVAIPSSPGGIGVVEAAYVGALSIFKIDASKAFAFALLGHFIYYTITAIFGIIGLFREGESLSHFYHRIFSRRSINTI